VCVRIATEAVHQINYVVAYRLSANSVEEVVYKVFRTKRSANIL
jgi:hypothetical protein